MTTAAPHVLLVEDEPAHASLIRKAFDAALESYHLSVVGSLEAAHAAIAKHVPHVIVSDMVLPDGRGTELLPNGRSAPYPVVMMTSYGDEQVAVEAMRAGAVDYVVKSPTAFSDMPATIDRALRHWNDIVERRRAETALARSEARCSNIIRSTMDAVVTVDDSMQVVAFNPAAEKMFGRRAGDVLGRDVAMLSAEKARPSVSECIKSANPLVQDGLVGNVMPSMVQGYGSRANGTEFPFEGSASAVEEDGRLFYTIILRDITERLAAEHALKRSNEDLERNVATRTAELSDANAQLRAEVAERRRVELALRQRELQLRVINDNVPALISYVDFQERCQFANRRFAESFGRRQETLIGMPLRDVWGAHAYEANRAQVEAALSGRQTAFETTIQGPAGRVTWWRSEFVPDVHEDGHVRGFFALMSDITSQKKAEQEVRAEQRLLKNLLDLQENERRLVSYEIHDGFVQDVVGAKMFFDTGCAKLPTDDVPIEFMGVNQCLQKAVVEARRLVNGLRPMAIDDLGVVEALEHLVAESSLPTFIVNFQHHVPGEQFSSLLRTTLFRIAQEALNNARRHSRSPKADLHLEMTSAGLLLEIRDYGVGFDPQRVPDDRFGLQGMQERARLAGGVLTLESSLGQGTTIHVVFPHVKDMPIKETTAESGGPTRRSVSVSARGR